MKWTCGIRQKPPSIHSKSPVLESGPETFHVPTSYSGFEARIGLYCLSVLLSVIGFLLILRVELECLTWCSYNPSAFQFNRRYAEMLEQAGHSRLGTGTRSLICPQAQLKACWAITALMQPHLVAGGCFAWQ